MKMYDKAKTVTYDVIIVPGVPLKDGKWDRTMKARIYWSKFLYDKGIAKNIMYSGSAVYSPYYEGEVMVMYAEAIGIPKEHIYRNGQQSRTLSLYEALATNLRLQYYRRADKRPAQLMELWFAR